jgi:DnaJ family protein B protein 4
MSNFYEILGVSQDATEAEIKKAYRQLSLKYHPDRNPSDEAKSTFQKIGEAYETLSDPEKRNQYNHQLRFGAGGGFQPDGFNDVNDINQMFNMLFGGGFGMMPGMHMGGGPGPSIRIFHSENGGPGIHTVFHQNMQPQPEPIITSIRINIELSYQGCVYPLEIERWILQNNVRTTEKEMIYIHIPQGVDDNEQIILKDKGNCIQNCFSDLRINVQVENNSVFSRSGLDLIFRKQITLKEALCGFSFEIFHLNGKQLLINNKNNHSVIKPQYTKIVPSLGMIREQTSGNMVIIFDILFPDSLTPEQIATLETLL